MLTRKIRQNHDLHMYISQQHINRNNIHTACINLIENVHCLIIFVFYLFSQIVAIPWEQTCYIWEAYIGYDGEASVNIDTRL